MKLYLPTPLRRHVGGAKEIEASGTTIREAILGLNPVYPRLVAELWDADNDALKKYLTVFLNDTNIRTLQGADTPVAANDILAIIPAIAGGFVA